MSPFFQTLAVNNKGNDFFIGDIHGAFSKLTEHLEHIHFNPKTDRLICVGDLIDRGEYSFQALDWLQRPYFHSVRGNHEELYLQWATLTPNSSGRKAFEQEAYFPNGGAWVANHSSDEHEKLFAQLVRLPYILVVPNRMGKKVAAVHAGLPDGCSWPELEHQDISPSLVRDLVWSTDRLHSHLGHSSKHIFDEGHIPGLDAVVCGHIKVNEPVWAGRFLYLETQGWKEEGRFSTYSLDDILRISRQY